MTLGNLMQSAQRRLASQRETANLEIQLLLAHIFKKPKAWIITHPEASVTPGMQAEFDLLLQRIVCGEPLPYILGHWEFFGLDFLVSPAVLIPRPETELLVETALAWLQKQQNLKNRSSEITAIDVGTGSGCIAVSLAVHAPQVRLAAVDRSKAALGVAHQNLARHPGASKVALVESDLLTCFAPAPIFNLVCANLPYIPSDRLPNLAIFEREPAIALDGGARGLQVIQQLLPQCRLRLAPPGLLLLEIDSSQAEAVRTLAKQAFPSASSQILRDLAGQDRLAVIELPS